MEGADVWLGVALVGVTLTCWILVALSVTHFAAPQAVRRGHHTLAWTSALTMLLAASLYARIALSIGEWPRAASFDWVNGLTPSNFELENFRVHADLVALSLFVLTLSVFAFPPLHALLWLSAERPSWRWLAVWGGGWLVALVSVFSDDPRALGVWLF